jgi:hypothetical protein
LGSHPGDTIDAELLERNFYQLVGVILPKCGRVSSRSSRLALKNNTGRAWARSDELLVVGTAGARTRAGGRLQARSISRRKLPRPARLREILNLIDTARATGQVIYLHSSRVGGIEDVVAGCWLVRRGLGGKQALAKLQELRQGLLDGWQRAPSGENAPANWCGGWQG